MCLWSSLQMFPTNIPMHDKVITPITKAWGFSYIKGDYYTPLMSIRESWQIIVRPLKSIIVFLSITAKSLSINTNYVTVFSLKFSCINCTSLRLSPLDFCQLGFPTEQWYEVLRWEKLKNVYIRMCGCSKHQGGAGICALFIRTSLFWDDLYLDLNFAAQFYAPSSSSAAHFFQDGLQSS